MAQNTATLPNRAAVGHDLIHELLSLPFLDPQQYKLRVRAITRDAAAEIERLRGARIDQPIDFPRQRITDRHGKQWQLSPCNWRLLMVLISKAGCIVPHAQIIAGVYGHDPDGGPLWAANNIKVMITRLRKRSPWPIRSVHGVGYVLEGYRP